MKLKNRAELAGNIVYSIDRWGGIEFCNEIKPNYKYQLIIDGHYHKRKKK